MSGAVHGCAIIGLGGVGRSFLSAAMPHPRWRVRRVCDLNPDAVRAALAGHPGPAGGTDAAEVLADPAVEAVFLTTRADRRPELIRRCLAAGKHILAEKPLAADSATDQELLREIAGSGLLCAVNLPNRHAWYHDLAHAAIAAGEIGAVGAVSVSHQTQGGLPDPANPKPEGPPFANCGMHYVDVVRWFAGAEIVRWHAEGLRLWEHPEPWWMTMHGRCANGVIVQVVEGFAWAQACPQRHNLSRLEIVGSLGGIVVSHDFRTATVEVHGVSGTSTATRPYGGKHLGSLLERFAASLDAGRNLGCATAEDCVRSAVLAREVLAAATAAAGSACGTGSDLALVRERKRVRDAAAD